MGSSSSLWIIIPGNNLWFTVTGSDATRITLRYGPSPSERKRSSALEGELTAAMLICPVYLRLIIAFLFSPPPPAVMTFPEGAVKSSFIAAHSSKFDCRLLISAQALARSRNDYFTKS